MKKNIKKKINCPKPNILLVNLESDIAGAEKSLILLTKYLQNKFTLSLACPHAGPLPSTVSRYNIKTLNISSPPAKINLKICWLIYLIIVNFQLLFHTIKQKPQLIHANSLKATLACTLASLMTKTPLIWHARDIAAPKFAAKLAAKISKKIIAISSAVKNALINKGVPLKKIHLIYNGTETDRHAKKLSKEDPTSFTFANIGQFVPWKKQSLFIEAARNLTNKNARFFVIGDDIFKRNARHKTRLLNEIKACQNKIDIIHILWQKNIENFWPQIDCLVHTADAEPFGRVIIEAMANNVPVIAADAAGAAEIIENNHTGLLVKPDAPRQLAEAMLRIAQDTEFAKKITSNAKNHVTKNFQAKTTAEKITNIYNQIIEQKNHENRL